MSETPALDGPRFGPAAGGETKQIIMLLHGIGADGRDLIELAPHLAPIFPNALFVAPNAPNRYDQGLSGYQWISRQIRVEAEVLAAVRASAAILDAFIDNELIAAQVPPNQLALVGFSQGTMMALHVAARRIRPVAGVLGYSGRLVAPDALAEEIRSRPPVFLVHGARDPVLPAECMTAASEALEANDFTVQTLLRPELGHSIDEDGLVQGTQFLRAVLGV